MPPLPSLPSKELPPGPVARSAGLLIMLLLIASLSMGLGALVVFYFFMRAESAAWPPPDAPPLPAVGLVASTAVILASSFTLHRAGRALRRENAPHAARLTWLTFGLGVVFLGCQAGNWVCAWLRDLPPGRSIYAVTFYLLTGLHGAHILGGLIPLGIVGARLQRNRYTPERRNGPLYAAIYWHFVGVVWLAFCATLLLGPHLPLLRPGAIQPE